MEQRQYWAFTFMNKQSTLAGCYTLIYGTFGETRQALAALIGDRWGFQYAYDQNIDQLEDLRQVPLNLAVREVHDGPEL